MGKRLEPPLPVAPPAPPRDEGRVDGCCNILLADAEPQVRSALRLVLSHEEGLAVTGEADCAEQVLAQIAAAPPHILLLAWGLPGDPTHELLVRVRALDPELCIVVMSGQPEARPSSAQAGADAFVSKVESPSRLIETIQEMARRSDSWRTHNHSSS